jgi:hypothetical protein
VRMLAATASIGPAFAGATQRLPGCTGPRSATWAGAVAQRAAKGAAGPAVVGRQAGGRGAAAQPRLRLQATHEDVAPVAEEEAGSRTFQQPVWLWEESGDAVKAYGAFFGILLAGLIPAVQVGGWRVVWVGGRVGGLSRKARDS